MKTKLLFIIFFGTIVANLYSQDPNQELTNRMNYIFQYLDKTKVETGLLSDYGIQPMELDYFDGVPADSNYVDIDAWQMLYSGLFSSKINNNVSLSSPETVFNTINTASSSAVPLAVMHYRYNKLNENAVSLGLLRVENDQIKDVAGAASPYLTKQLFAVAPKTLYFDGPTASFVFLSGLKYSNISSPIQKLEINFNNEGGFRTASWNVPLSYTFTSGGVKSIYFKLTYVDGTSYTSRTNIHVTEISQLRSSQNNGFVEIPIVASSQHSGGKMQIKYSTFNSSGQIKKPLIVAEGFDASCVISSQENVDLNDFIKNSFNYTTTFGTINLPYSGGNLLANIDYSQYDLIYLDYNNGVDDIRRNARLFQEVIRYVNNNKQGTEPNVVLGISMGGLVARYALRKMELDGENHQTWKYISMDSPHRGANVPVSIQAAVRHLESMNLKIFFFEVWRTTRIKDFKGVVDLLNSMAAQQMLIYYVNSNLNYDPSVHGSFMYEYNDMGFPQQCQNITISNGSNSGALSFPSNSELISMTKNYSLSWWLEVLNIYFKNISFAALNTNFPALVLNIFPGKTQITAKVFADAIPDRQSKRIYSGSVHFKKKILWLVDVSVTISEKNLNSSSSMYPIDGAPGGKYSIDMMGGDALPIDTSYIKQKMFCFVPTVSALALNNWQQMLTQNISGRDFYKEGSSDFSQFFTQNNNELHTRFNSSADFLYKQLNSPPISFKKTESVFCGDKLFEINNPKNAGVSWTVDGGFSITSSNNNSATVRSPFPTSTGILTVNTNYGSARKRISSLCGIVGPSSVACANTQISYSLDNMPEGTTIEWGTDSKLELISGQGTATATYFVRGPGYTTVTAKVGGSSTWINGPKIWIGKPERYPAVFNGGAPIQVNMGFPYLHSYSVSGLNSPSEMYFWYSPSYYTMNSSFDSNTKNTLYNFSINFPNAGLTNITSEFFNQCGSVSYKDAFYVNGYYYMTYPNPTSGIITIKEENNSKEENYIATSKSSSQSLLLQFTTAGTGTLMKKLVVNMNKEITVDVGDLPNGQYILSIVKDGKVVSSHNIIVKK